MYLLCWLIAEIIMKYVSSSVIKKVYQTERVALYCLVAKSNVTLKEPKVTFPSKSLSRDHSLFISTEVSRASWFGLTVPRAKLGSKLINLVRWSRWHLLILTSCQCGLETCWQPACHWADADGVNEVEETVIYEPHLGETCYIVVGLSVTGAKMEMCVLLKYANHNDTINLEQR